jgi:hypothetical protein
MAEDELNVYSASSQWHVPSCVINLCSLPSPCLFIWPLGTGDWTWHMESQEFGPWVQNSSFSSSVVKSLPNMNEALGLVPSIERKKKSIYVQIDDSLKKGLTNGSETHQKILNLLYMRKLYYNIV